ncbi:hypothetical protein ACSHWG_00960 [Leucobacter sp. Z1108]|uniref:hypothetical protein n=1 Tax=Leucobacter sp. Z1108 TaxID=3439066 RepID=UPI003F3F2EC7
MATRADPAQTLNRERTPDDLPDIVKQALAEHASAIARGDIAPQYDEHGFEVTENG